MIFRKIQTFCRLPPHVRRIALESLVLPLVVQSGFALRGVIRTRAFLEDWTGGGREVDATSGFNLIRDAVRAQGLVRRATGVGGTCLVRSLVLQAILRKRGVATDLRIGIRKLGSVAEGHAWLEFRNIPINESPETAATYAVSEELAGAEAWRSF